MSGGYSAIRYLEVGKQTGVTDSPATTSVDPQGDFTFTADQTKIPIEVQRDDGEITAPVLGPKSGGFSFTGLVRGKGSGAGDGIPAVAGEYGACFDALCGASASLGTGLDSATGHDTDTINLSSTAGFPVGNGLLINSDSAGTRYEAREVITLNASPVGVELDRALQGTPANGATAFASASWYIDADDSDHSFLYWIAEGENWRRDFWGCAVKFSMNCPQGGLAQFQWEVMANTWADVAEGSVTYASPTSAAALSVLGSPFFIGADKTELIDCTITANVEPQPRGASEGSEGQNGFISNYQGATFQGRVYHTEALLNNFQSANTYDVAFQLGDVSGAATPGNCLYTRIPALAVETANIETYNGVDIINFTGRATRPTAGNGSIRFHLFAG